MPTTTGHPPTKGQRTRERIVDAAAVLLNDRGYHAATLQELMEATGLQKGGIYNHFDSRDDLVVAAYERNTEIVAELLDEALERERAAPARLHAIVDVYHRFAHDPPFPGGCPTLNGGVQSVTTGPRLQERVAEVLRRLLDDVVAHIARSGVRRGELRGDVEPDALARVIVAAIEGGMLLSQLLADPSQFDAVAAHLHAHISSLTVEEPRS